jgi:hypothetical protein
MRRALLLLVLLAAAIFPAAAAAAAPSNDEASGAVALPFTYNTPTTGQLPVQIPQHQPAGGWDDATVSALDPVPSCAGTTGYHSMWYTVAVPEASVLTVSLTSSAPGEYQPIVTIYGDTPALPELACGQGGSDSRTSSSVASASSFVPKGVYFVRIAAGQETDSDAPAITLTAQLRDVTAPAIMVQIPTKVVGVGQVYTFSAKDSTDLGSQIDYSQTLWQYHDGGAVISVPATADATSDALIGTHAFRTPGSHKVELQLSDKAGNRSTYDFYVFVHNFVPPKVSLLVHVPKPGAGKLTLKIAHDVPVNVRLVVYQGGTLLRAIPKKLLKGKKATSFSIALKSKVKAQGGNIVISGVASDLGQYPNVVPLLTCSVDPVGPHSSCA